MKNILLIGYYGKENFGDDVLFKITYNIVSQWQPNANISVLCEPRDNYYFSNLIGKDIRVIHHGAKEYFDVIIHGGGGTFFDFNESSLSNLFINNFIKTIGFSTYKKVDSLIRKITHKEGISCDTRYGLGIGVGTYTESSEKLKYNIPTLLDFDCLIVRDKLSIKNLNTMSITENIKLGSDLAFLNNFWLPKNIYNNTQTQEIKNIGIILRDWSKDKDYLKKIKHILKPLSKKYELTLFIFDKTEDLETIDMFSDYATLIWDSMSIKFDDYCQRLASQDILITSRAHGAICGAVLGVPSIIIEIEPKLQTIHSLLPTSTVLLTLKELNLSFIEKSISKLLTCEKKEISYDVNKNKNLMKNIIDLILVGK